jgi:hypothetical protein
MLLHCLPTLQDAPWLKWQCLQLHSHIAAIAAAFSPSVCTPLAPVSAPVGAQPLRKAAAAVLPRAETACGSNSCSHVKRPPLPQKAQCSCSINRSYSPTSLLQGEHPYLDLLGPICYCLSILWVSVH